MWNEREKALVDEEGTPAQKTSCGYCHTRPLACLPNKSGAMLGTLGHFSSKMGADSTWDRIASEAARTVPGRENGGNCDMCATPLPVRGCGSLQC
jgi:formamidase